MGLRGRLQNSPLPLNVMIVLCICVLVGGLAWADSFDLTDDVGILHTSPGVILDSDGDEVRENLDAVVLTGVFLSGRMPPPMPQLLPVMFSSLCIAPSQNPLYERFCSFRI